MDELRFGFGMYVGSRIHLYAEVGSDGLARADFAVSRYLSTSDPGSEFLGGPYCLCTLLGDMTLHNLPVLRLPIACT